MKLALNENCIPQTDLISFVRLAAKEGFTAVELTIDRLEEALLCHPSNKITALLHDLGVSVLSVNGFSPYFTPLENRKLLEKQCEYLRCLCESVECPTILAPAGFWPTSLGKKPAWRDSYDLQKENLLVLAEILERSGISVAVEPVGGADFSFTKLKEADELIQECRLQTIGLAPDIHLQVCADDKPEDLRSVKSPIFLFHLDDTLDLPGKVPDIQKDRTFPGEGAGHSNEWVSAALDTGYSGYFSLELFSSYLGSLPADEAVELCSAKASEFSESFHKNPRSV